MKIRDVAWLGAKTVTGLLSAFVSLHAISSARTVDFRANPVLTVLYCVFSGLSFLVFLFVRSPRLEGGLQTILALGYLTTFSMLNWRTCAELGYCGAIASTVLETLKTRPVAAAFGVAILSCTSLLLDDSRRRRMTEDRSKGTVVG